MATRLFIVLFFQLFQLFFQLVYHTPKRLPNLCVCGKKFDVDHANNCGRGGFIIRRHNEIRDVVAELLDDVAYDVRIEPPLQALTGNEGLSNSEQRE